MRSTRTTIHQSLTNGPVLLSDLHNIKHFLGLLDCKVRQLFDIDTLVGVLVELQPVLRVLCKQVTNLFIVNLNIAGTDEELGLVGVFGDAFEDVVEGAGHDTPLLKILIIISTRHGMGLTGTGLTVGEDRAVITFEHVSDNRVSSLFIDLLLRFDLAIGLIEGELLGGFGRARLRHEDLSFVRRADDGLVTVGFLLGVQGTAPNDDLHGLTLFFYPTLLLFICHLLNSNYYYIEVQK